MKTLLLALLALFALLCALPARGETLWLVIGATDPSPAGIASKARAFSGTGLILQTRDCGDKENRYGWAMRIGRSEPEGSAALLALREAFPDAYLKECRVRPGSLLAYRFPAVDPSIADVPASAVTWEDRDRVSTVKPLHAGKSLVLVRRFEAGSDDPREGKRESVYLVGRSGKPRELENDCVGLAQLKSRSEHFAFQCAREQTPNALLHSVLVFDAKGDKLREVGRCRNPVLQGPGYLDCDRESVGADGRLKLETLRFELP